MSIVIQSFVTVTCDTIGCNKAATFPQTPEGEQEALQAIPWITTLRFVQTADQKKFVYCSDECEAKAAGLGLHNKTVLVAAQGPNSIELAAQAAERAKKATELLKQGTGKIEISNS